MGVCTQAVPKISNFSEHSDYVSQGDRYAGSTRSHVATDHNAKPSIYLTSKDLSGCLSFRHFSGIRHHQKQTFTAILLMIPFESDLMMTQVTKGMLN